MYLGKGSNILLFIEVVACGFQYILDTVTKKKKKTKHKIASKEMHGEKEGTLCCTIEGRRDKVTWNLVAFKIILVIDMKRSCMEIDLLSLFCFAFYTFFR